MEIRDKIKNIKIIHWNCNSINNKIEEFKDFIIKFNPEIVLLNETKINDFMANVIFSDFVEYDYLHKQRSSKNGAGGVAIMIKKQLKFESFNIFGNLNLEILTIKIQLNKKDLIIASYYNPPDIQLSEKVFTILSEQKKDFLVNGDLNAKTRDIGCTSTNNNGVILEHILREHDCLTINDNVHTHNSFSGTSSDILDFVVCSASTFDSITKFQVLNEHDMTSDHFPIVLELNNGKMNINDVVKQNNDSYDPFNLNKANWVLFKSHLPKNTPTEILNDVEQLNDFVMSSLLNAANLSIPKTRKNTKYHKSLPNYILMLINKRKFHRKLAKKGKQGSKQAYNHLTKIIREEIDSLESVKWNTFLEKQGKNPTSSKPFWQRIKKYRGNNSSNTIPSLLYNDTLYETDAEKANLFAKILKKTFSDDQNDKFDDKFKIKVETIVNQHDYSRHNYKNRDCFNMKDLNRAIKSLKSFSAPGLDKVHNQMMKNTTLNFRRIILCLIN